MEEHSGNSPYTPGPVENYFGTKLVSACLLLEGIADDPQVESRFRRTSALLHEVTEALDTALSEIDLKLCGESTRDDCVLDWLLERELGDGLDRAISELGEPPVEPEPRVEGE